jgi:GDP-fucose protein O-fucosyltransferase
MVTGSDGNTKRVPVIASMRSIRQRKRQQILYRRVVAMISLFVAGITVLFYQRRLWAMVNSVVGLSYESDMIYISIDTVGADNIGQKHDTEAYTAEGDEIMATEIVGASLDGLSCDAHGGPSSEIAQHMVYWGSPSNHTHRYTFQSPYYTLPNDREADSNVSMSQAHYLLFDMDHGGWNNIRMALEVAVVMAVYTGRTLVLPPRQAMYLLTDERTPKLGVQDFYHWDRVAKLSADSTSLRPEFRVVTLSEFVRMEQVRLLSMIEKESQLRDKSGTISQSSISERVWNMLRQGGGGGATILDWNCDECVAVFPTANTSAEAFQTALDNILQQDQLRYPGSPRPWLDRIVSYTGRPTAVNASMQDRLAEMLAHRRKLCVYNETLQSTRYLYMPNEFTGHRFLVHFYAFLFFDNWRDDLWIKRWVRDKLRYRDDLQCSAARVVHALCNMSADGTFDSMHVRRNDFQYNHSWLNASTLYKQHTNKIISDGRVLFIATDEVNRTFFEPLHDHYRLLFLSDFESELVNISASFYGMLDQLIASQGKTFIGTYFSTFTGFINRMRGYQGQRRMTYGYKHGLMESYYMSRPSNATLNVRRAMRMYRCVSAPFWKQEFATAWRMIDSG